MHQIKTVATVFLAVLLSATPVCGQTSKIDSLESLLAKHTRADIMQVDLLNDLAYEIFSSDPLKAKAYSQRSGEIAGELGYEKGQAASLWITGLTCLRYDRKEALGYFRQALSIAEKVDDQAGICNYLTAIGNVSKELGDIAASNQAHERALKIALDLDDKRLILKCRINLSRNLNSGGNPVEAVRQLHEVVRLSEQLGDSLLLARSYSNLGGIYQVQGDAPTSLKYYLSALHIYEKQNGYSGISTTQLNIAGIYCEMSEFDSALEMIRKVQALSRERGDSLVLSVSYTNMGNIYQRMGRPEALDCFRQALKTSKQSNMSQDVNSLMNIGVIQMDRGEYGEAEKSLDEALLLSERMNKSMDIGSVYACMGLLAQKQKHYAQAVEYINLALDLARKSRYALLHKDCRKQLSDIYAATGNYKEAYAQYVQFKKLADSAYSEKDTRRIALLESSYQFDKERELYELEKAGNELQIRNQQQTILSLGLISLLVCALAIAIWWSSRLRKKMLSLRIEQINRELEANQKAMAVAKLKLLQNSERDAQHVRQLEEIEKDVSGSEQKNVRQLIGDFKAQTFHSNWEEFETLFTKVNTSFLDKLTGLYPDLTPNERKLCVFLKLTMSSKDIAQITFQSEEALKKSRLRLRRKLGLDRDTNLTAFIQGL